MVVAASDVGVVSDVAVSDAAVMAVGDIVVDLYRVTYGCRSAVRVRVRFNPTISIRSAQQQNNNNNNVTTIA